MFPFVIPGTPEELSPEEAIRQNVLPTQPEPPPAPATPPPAYQKQGASFSGVTDEGIGQAKRVYSGTDARVAAQTAPLASQANQNLAQHRSNVAQIGDAQSEQAQLTKQYQANMAAHKESERRFHMDAAAFEERLHLESKAESEAYVGAYREQLAAVRAMTVDPTGPVGTLTTAQAGGLSLAMFAQGFLAAQGIQIDVSGQLDRWVDRSIQEQQRRIQQAEKGAQDILNLWEIARQSSHDDLEARTRYRGMVLAGMMAATEAKAAQFNSDIATSRAKEANARLAIELGAVERQIQDGYFNKVHAIKQAEYQRAYQMGSLAQQRKQLDETVRHNKELEKAKDNSGPRMLPVKDVGDYQVDPKTKRPISGGKIVGYVKEGSDAEKEINKAQKSHGELLKGLDELEKLRAEAMKNPLVVGSKMLSGIASEEYRQFDRRRGLIVAGIQKAMTGLHANESEQKLYRSQLEDDKFWQAGSNASTLVDLRSWSRDAYNNSVNNLPGVTIIPESERKYSDFVEADPNTLDMKEAAEAARKEEPMPPGIAAEMLDKAMNADSRKRLDWTRGTSNMYQQYLQAIKQQGTPEFAYRKEHEAMELLAMLVATPEQFAGDESPAEIRTEAIQALKKLSGDDGYARFVLGIATERPGDLLSVMQPQSYSMEPSIESKEALKLK